MRNKKTIDGRKYGYDGDFVVEEYTFGRQRRMMDDITEAMTEVTEDGRVVPRNAKPGLLQFLQIRYALTGSPEPVTEECIDDFPLALVKEIMSAIEEVNKNTNPLVAQDIGMGML